MTFVTEQTLIQLQANVVSHRLFTISLADRTEIFLGTGPGNVLGIILY